MKHFYFVQGDRPTLTFTIQRNGTAVDLSGTATADFMMKLADTSVYKINSSCTNLTSTGTCQYTVGSSDFDTIGDYIGRVEITLNTKPEMTERFLITIEEF